MKKLLLLSAVLFFFCPTVHAQGKWIECFYPGWQKNVYSPARLDYTACTHVPLAFWTTAVITQVSVSGGTTTYTVGSQVANAPVATSAVAIGGFINAGNNGLFTVTGSTGSSFTVATTTQVNETTNAAALYDAYGWDTSCSAVVTPAHAAGDKVTASLGGASDGSFASAVADNTNGLIAAAALIVTQCGLDGVDLDWETSINNTNFSNLASSIKTAHPTWVITVPLDPTVNPASLALSLSSSVTHMNMQTYGLGNFFSTSSYFFPNFETANDWVDTYVQAWLTAGVPAAKIGIGIGFFAETWTTPCFGVNQTSTSGCSVNDEIPYGWSIPNGGGVLSCYYPTATTMAYGYDPSPALDPSPAHRPDQPQLSTGSTTSVTPPSGCPVNGSTGNSNLTWATYEDEPSVAAKAAYVKSNNLGGVIIWTVDEGNTDPNTGRNPLLDSLNLNLNNKGVLPLPQIGAIASANIGSGGGTIGPITSGIAGTDMIVVKLWNASSGCAWDWNNSGACGNLTNTNGMPKNYTVQAAPAGSPCGTFTTLTTITNEQYAAREFSYDNSSTNYACVKIVVTAIQNSANGNDYMTVNGSSTSYDVNETVGQFGDSITANCWTSNYNTGDSASTAGTEEFGTLIHAARPARFPVAISEGNSGWSASTALANASFTSGTATEIAIKRYLEDTPAIKYVWISLGTNDANGGVAAATYCNEMQQISQYVIAAGKTPIIPSLIPSPGLKGAGGFSNWTLVQNYNSCLTTLEQNFPAIIPGPDLFTLFCNGAYSPSCTSGSPTEITSWWLTNGAGELHPSIANGQISGGVCVAGGSGANPCGCTALQTAWANTLETAIFPLAASSTPITINGGVTLNGGIKFQ